MDFAGIGVPRCATSWVFSCLKEHPEICGSSQKETNFFRHDYKYEKGLEFYKEFFEYCSEESLKGEFTPYYLSDERVPERLHRKFPEVKLIILLRDPVERFYSHYKFAKKTGQIGGHYNSLEEAIDERDFRLTENGKYGEHLARWRDFFPSEHMHVVLYKAIKSNPDDVIQDIYRFLGVDSNFTPSAVDEKKNVTGEKEVKLRISKITKLIHAVTNKVKKNRSLYSILNKTLLKNMHGKLLSWNRQKRQRGKTNSTSISDMSSESRRKLCKIYRKDVQRLGQLINKDLSHWEPYEKEY